MLDVTYGNMSEAEALRMATATGDVALHDHEPGSTEPWVSRLVASFAIGIGARSILETGCFKGATSLWLARALSSLGGGELHLCEIDRQRLETAIDRVAGISDVKVRPWPGDVITFLRACRMRFDLAWVDDNHEKAHVWRELQFLLPCMNPGGLVLLHDVYGSCDLQEVVQKFGGYSIDLPRMGPAGGLGVIQCR